MNMLATQWPLVHLIKVSRVKWRKEVPSRCAGFRRLKNANGSLPSTLLLLLLPTFPRHLTSVTWNRTEGIWLFLVFLPRERGESDILFLKHYSSVFRQSSNPVCGSWKSQVSSLGQTAQSLTCSIVEKPHTGLDDCLNMLLSCVRKNMSGGNPEEGNWRRDCNKVGAPGTPTGIASLTHFSCVMKRGRSVSPCPHSGSGSD